MLRSIKEVEERLLEYPYSQWLNSTWVVRNLEPNWIHEELDIWESDVQIVFTGLTVPSDVLFAFRMESDWFRFVNEVEELLGLDSEDYELSLS